MAMDEDEEDYVHYGTPIEREEDVSIRKRKAITEAGQLRSLPTWKQEVTDEEGRRRFHGAFTGGFSAGYYNTVGSKEGWAPQTFTSSRKSRAEVKQQSIYSFMDDEDIKDIGGNALETSTQFDTFGFTASEFARKQAVKDQEKRPSAIPGPAPDDIVLPAADSIGIKLLQKMGWRQGRLIKDMHAESLRDARREARKALIAFSGGNKEPEFCSIESSMPISEDLIVMDEHHLSLSRSIPVYVLHPKKDLHGLGFDPFKHAPEFRDRKNVYKSGNTMRENRRYFSAIGSGKYKQHVRTQARVDHDGDDDEDFYDCGSFELEEVEDEEVEPVKTIGNIENKLEHREHGLLSGFKVASSADLSLQRFQPPAIPPDFKPQHRFYHSLEVGNASVENPPLEVPSPEDGTLKSLIDGFATLVARCGKRFEDLSKEKHKSNPLFSFLSGGSGHAYYERKLWEAKQTNPDRQMLVDVKSKSVSKLTAENRGKILGERPLEKSSIESASSSTPKDVIHLQSNLSDTFTRPPSLVDLSESMRPFNTDPAKQQRFEQFLKDKYHGGLRSTYSGGSAMMSETDRARERLDFEAAAEIFEKRESNIKTDPPSVLQFLELASMGERQFIPGSLEKHNNLRDEDKMTRKILPKREEFQWRPSPILCKRYDVVDPFMGKPPSVSRPRSRLDTLVFMSGPIENAPQEDIKAGQGNSTPTYLQEVHHIGKNVTADEIYNDPIQPSAHVPVDLYKAIFSDDSDSEGEGTNPNEAAAVDQPNKGSGVNETLNRLVAGDFLESLGKELGLEVSIDVSSLLLKASSVMEVDAKGVDLKISSGDDARASAMKITNKVPKMEGTSSRPMSQEMTMDSGPRKKSETAAGKQGAAAEGHTPSDQVVSRREHVGNGEDSRSKGGDVEGERRDHMPMSRTTHSRHHSRRSPTPGDEPSSDHRHRGRHSTRTEKRPSSRERSRRRHSKKRRKSHSYDYRDDTSTTDDEDGRDRYDRGRDKGSSHRESHHSSRSKRDGRHRKRSS